MKGKDQIEQLFSDKLGNFEAKVDPSLWSGVSSQLGAQALGSTAAGMSLVTKAIIGISAVSLIAVSVVIFMDNDEKPTRKVVANSERTIEPSNESEDVSVDNETKENITASINTLANKTEDYNPSLEVVIEDTGLFPNIEVLDQKAPGLTNEKTETVVETAVTEEIEELEIVPVVDEEIIIEAEEIELYTIDNLPNIFTPNGDGNNDLFSIKTKGLTDFSITILNTKNQVVFKSNDSKFIWNGLDFSQNQVAAGNYVYYITARDSAGNPVNKYSQLVIRR